MATVELLPKQRTPLFASSGLFTAADLAHFPPEVPSGPVDYELDNGVLVMMMRPSGRHAGLHARVTGYLFSAGEQLGYGQVKTEPGLVLWRNPDRVVGPDVAFFAKSIFPLRESREGYYETMPSLVVEVRSKNDSRPFIDRKVNDYLQAGVPLVWVVDADDQTVLVMRTGAATQTLGIGEVLTAENLIPGFRLPIADLFRE
jgi:Uma2 family endonuclease